MVSSRSKNPSSDRIMQTLAWIRKSGFKPVPLHPQSKAAISKKYVESGYEPPDDSYWQRTDHGIGVVTGLAAGGMIDGDLDCDEATFFAPRFMPPTLAVFGRPTKLRSHLLYRVREPLVKKAYIDPISADTILELRGDGGHQTVFPGSLHQDTGELIWWSDAVFPEVPVVEVVSLQHGAGKTAAATLIVRHAWMEGQRNEVCKHLAGILFYLKWTEDEATDFIKAIMDHAGDDDKTRLITVRNTFKKGEQGQRIVGATSLKKFIKDDRLVTTILDWLGSDTAGFLQEYNERFAVIGDGKFRIACTDVAPGQMPIFYQHDDFIRWMQADSIVTDEGKRIPKARVWLASPQRRSYRKVDFLPGVQDDDGSTLNLWTGWCLQPSLHGSCSAWLELLTDVICGGDSDLVTWLLHWFANILRDPMLKPLTAPVIVGRQGAGKSLLLTYFGRILGPAYVVVQNEEHVYGRFNTHLSNVLLLHSEEALYGGERKHRGIIKSLITDEYRIFEPKGVDAKQVRNFLRLVLTSNELHAAPAEAGDRRFTVFDLSDRIVKAALRDRVLEEMNGTGPAALFQYLLTMDYDPALPRTNVKNSSLRMMKSANFSPSEEWWYDVLCVGQLLPDCLSWASKPGNDDGQWPEIVSSRALHTAMVLHLRDRSARGQVPSETMLAIQLDRWIGRKLQRMQREFCNPGLDGTPPLVRSMSNRQSTVINMPPLVTCRKAFEKHVGSKIDWPRDLPEEDKGVWEKGKKDETRF